MFKLRFSIYIIIMNTTKILCQNCKIISTRDTYSRVLRFIKVIKPLLVCLAETRANSEQVDHFCSRIPRNWQWAAILSDGLSGGIIVIWNPIIGQVTPVASSHRALHLVVTTQASLSSIISVVYNSLKYRGQCFLWHELSRINGLGFPWLALGNFNSVLSCTEHKGGSFSYYARKSRFFFNFVNINNLLDLKFSDSPYTWCNN